MTSTTPAPDGAATTSAASHSAPPLFPGGTILG